MKNNSTDECEEDNALVHTFSPHGGVRAVCEAKKVYPPLREENDSQHKKRDDESHVHEKISSNAKVDSSKVQEHGGRIDHQNTNGVMGNSQIA